MIKVFTTNKDGKIELTKDELKNLLDEAYWDGHRAANVYTYRTPNLTPYVWTCDTGNTVSLNSIDATPNTIVNGQIEMDIGK